MPVNIYRVTPEGQENERVAWLCGDEWRLTPQSEALSAWLRAEGTKLEPARYVADIGFSWRPDACAGGPAFAPETLRQMADLGMSLFISEYAGFTARSDGLMHTPPDKAMQTDATLRSVARRISQHDANASRILKVDHAGEHGAVEIYRGQLLVSRWRTPAWTARLTDFMRHEQRHRATFAAELRKRGVRRCRSYHLCGVGGFMLGLLTGIFGSSAMAATTVAVERVVLAHLREQLAYLEGADPSGYQAVASILVDEERHHDEAALELEQGRFWPKVLMPVVSVSTETVIWLGMKL